MGTTENIKRILRESSERKNIIGVEITRPNQKLIVMRGVSGSGKSSRARELVGNGVIHSTDDLIAAQGDYGKFFDDMVAKNNFGPLHKMHGQNLRNAVASMEAGVTPVVIDNTNLTPSEPKAYVEAALKMGFDEKNIEFIEVGTEGVELTELARRNTHGVPFDKIEKMANIYNDNKNMTVEKVLESKDFSRPSRDVLYSAVVLDEPSREKLLGALKHRIPEGWTIIAHHMTIVFGKGLDDKEEVGKKVGLRATELGISDKVIAVKVEGYPSANKIPHITLAVAPDGKPVMSNNIENWTPLENYINLNGIVTEIKPK